MSAELHKFEHRDVLGVRLASTIDGVDPALGLIKGGGGALVDEKMVARASRREVIVIDAGKLSPRPGCGGGRYHTDQGNIILDGRFGRSPTPARPASTLEARAGLLGHRLFIGIAGDVIVARVPSGGRHLRRGPGIDRRTQERAPARKAADRSSLRDTT